MVPGVYSRGMLARGAVWDRVAGSLHGLLVGDALGCPVEGWTQAQIVEEFGSVTAMTEVPGARWRPRGLHSDDGQQALAVVDAICRDPDRPELPFIELMIALREGGAQRVGRWGLHRGVGRNFRSTVRGLQSTGVSDPFMHAVASAGNGAAMRVAPVGLWWRDDPETRDLRAAQISAVTHSDIRAISAAQTVAIVVAEAFSDQPGPVLDTALVAAVTRAQARAEAELGLEPDPRFVQLLEALVEHRGRCDRLAGLLRGIRERAMLLGGAEREVEATSGFAPCSVLAALAIVELAESFEDALITAVNLGGDTDTVGAMVGAMAGARLGFGSIPPRWLDDLHATGTLMERIDVVVRAEPGEPGPDLLGLEAGWDLLFERPPALG